MSETIANRISPPHMIVNTTVLPENAHLSDGFERDVRRSGQGDRDRVSAPHFPAGDNNRHDARFADQVAVFVAVEDCRHQPLSEPVELHAWGTKPGDLDDRLLAELPPRPGGQSEQVEPGRG